MTKSSPERQFRIETEEVSSVEKRAAEFGVKVPDGIGILPANFFIAERKADLKYQSHALDVKVLFRQEGLSVGMVEGEGAKIPFVEDRSAAWIGPIILFSAAAISTNPNIIALTLNILSNYIYDMFKGKEGEKNVWLSFVVEKTDMSRIVKFDFEGPPQDMPNIEKLIKETFK